MIWRHSFHSYVIRLVQQLFWISNQITCPVVWCIFVPTLKCALTSLVLACLNNRFGMGHGITWNSNGRYHLTTKEYYRHCCHPSREPHLLYVHHNSQVYTVRPWKTSTCTYTYTQCDGNRAKCEVHSGVYNTINRTHTKKNWTFKFAGIYSLFIGIPTGVVICLHM